LYNWPVVEGDIKLKYTKYTLEYQ